MPFSITVKENANFTVEEFQLPKGAPFKVDELEEEFFILPEEFEMTALLRVNKKPQLGELKIVVVLDMQACSGKACFAEGEVSVEVAIGVIKEL